MSTALNEALRCSAHREDIRKRFSEIPRASIYDTSALTEENSKKGKLNKELSVACMDVDKHIKLFDIALFDASRMILLKGGLSDPTLKEITALKEGLFQDAYEMMPESMRPTQKAPVEEEKKEPAFTDEKAAKQLNVIDAIKEAEEKRIKLVVAPELDACPVCQASILLCKDGLNSQIISFTCGTVKEKQQMGAGPEEVVTHYLAMCRQDVKMIGMVKDAEPVDTEVVEDDEPDMPEPCCIDALVQSGVDLEAAKEQQGDDFAAAAKEVCLAVNDEDPALAEACGGLIDEAREMFGSSLENVAAACAEADAEVPKPAEPADAPNSITQCSDATAAVAPAKPKRPRKKN